MTKALYLWADARRQRLVNHLFVAPVEKWWQDGDPGPKDLALANADAKPKRIQVDL
jgi:hypothetical protein